MNDRELTTADLVAVQQLIARSAFALDSHDYSAQLPAVFTGDVRLLSPGRDAVIGLPALVALLESMADPAISHHVSTTVVEPTSAGEAECHSKVITLRSADRRSAAEFVDRVRREGNDWKIAAREIRPIG